MEDYNAQDNGLNKKAIVLLERILVELERLKIDKITDVTLRRNYENLITEVNHIITLINKNPRFDWVILQEEIDRLYTLDKSLSGIHLKLRWREGKNFAFINGKLGKAS
tara:strand:- start:17556 stop:17882 length:327 start_codon:yes stop_codon:yes gene_type:complete